MLVSICYCEVKKFHLERGTPFSFDLISWGNRSSAQNGEGPWFLFNKPNHLTGDNSLISEANHLVNTEAFKLIERVQSKSFICIRRSRPAAVCTSACPAGSYLSAWAFSQNWPASGRSVASSELSSSPSVAVSECLGLGGTGPVNL